jgi:hypothetical protein
MGVSCGLHLITAEAFSAVSRGDMEGFDTEESRVDLDKAWHVISYLVTGDPDHDFLKGGVQLPDVSEHCEAHSPASIAELSNCLRQASAETLLSGFDADKFNASEIYPGDWDERGAQYVRPYLDRFVGLVHRAADEKKGMLVVIA